MANIGVHLAASNVIVVPSLYMLHDGWALSAVPG
jgi:hypothetical protein